MVMVVTLLGFVVTLEVVVGVGVVVGVVVVGHGVVDFSVMVVLVGVEVGVVLHSDMCPSGPIVHLGAPAAWLSTGAAETAELATSFCCMTPAKAGAASPKRVTKRTILEEITFHWKKKSEEAGQR
jgi:hypothetical protein